MKKEVTVWPFLILLFVMETSVYVGHYLINTIGEIWTMMIISAVAIVFHLCLLLVNKLRG